MSNILEFFNKATKKDSSIIIGLNYYYDITNKSPNPSIKIEGSNLYIDGVLRMVSRSDEEWESIFGKYFITEKLEHFAWPNENKETRRLFYLKKK